jgi:hypothetical protein
MGLGNAMNEWMLGHVDKDDEMVMEERTGQDGMTRRDGEQQMRQGNGKTDEMRTRGRTREQEDVRHVERTMGHQGLMMRTR